MPYCQVKNANMYYEEYGSGTPIVMIHGFSPDHQLMKGCMEPIFKEREGYRRIYLDLPGMGKTKDYENINNTDDMLAAVIELIEQLVGDEPFLLAGQSYGGYMTRGIIAKMPKRVLGAAFLSPMIIPEFDERTLPKHVILQVDEKFIATLTEEEREDFKGINVVLDENNWKRYSEEVLSGIKLADGDHLDKILKTYGYTFQIDKNEFIKPCVFLTGRQDSMTGYADVYNILDKYPRATFAILDMAGHNMQIEQADLLTAHINEWLDRVGKEIKEKTHVY